MFHPYIYTLILLASLLFTSCASLSNNELISKQTVLVDSIPQNADIFYNGELVGSTPMELSLPTGIAHKVTLKKEGVKNKKEEKKLEKKKAYQFMMLHQG